jgi:hypothetical protein
MQTNRLHRTVLFFLSLTSIYSRRLVAAQDMQGDIENPLDV